MRIGIVALLLVVSAFAIGCGNEALVEVTPAVNAAGDAQGTKTDLDLQKAKELYEAGLAFFAQGQMEEAIRKYDEAIRLSSDTPGAYAGRGLAYSNLGQFQRAVQDFDAAIRLNPQNADAYNNRGLAFGELGDFNKAVQDFDASIRLNPQRADAYNNRGLAYGELGDFNKAVQDFDASIRLNPQRADAYNNRGLAYGELGDFNKAVQDFDAAIRLNPQNADAYNNRGLAYGELGDFRLAARDFGQALRLKPELIDIKELLAQMQIKILEAQGTKVPAEEPNLPPVIGVLIANPLAAEPNTVVNLTAEAGDPDGDALTYRWLLDGKLLGTGRSLVWNAPQPEGAYVVTVEVSDGKETVTRTVGLSVVNVPPKILGVTSKPMAGQGKAPSDHLLQRVAEFGGETVPPWTLSLEVEAVDPNEDPLYYQWSQLSGDEGSFSDPGIAAPTWTPPRVSKDTTILLLITVGEVREGTQPVSMEIKVPILLSGTKLSASKSVGAAPLAVDFTAVPFPEGTAVKEYRWDFDGDGVDDLVTPGPSATFTYKEEGAFVPVVTTWDANNSILGVGEEKKITVGAGLALGVSKNKVLAGEQAKISVTGLTPGGPLTLVICDPSGKCQSSSFTADKEGKFAQLVSGLDLPGIHTQEVADKGTGQVVLGSIAVSCAEGQVEAGGQCTQAAKTVLLAHLLSKTFGADQIILLSRIAGGYTANADAGCATDHLHAGFPSTFKRQPPNLIQGTVVIDGVAPPDGTVITPWIDGNQVPLMVGEVNGGIYSIKVLQPTGTFFDGKEIWFKIGDFFANQTIRYSVGEVYELNLTAISSVSDTRIGGITIDGMGPLPPGIMPGGLNMVWFRYADPDSAGCGYGKVVR